MYAQDDPANWAIHHDMAGARFGASQPNAAICHRMAAFLPSLPSYTYWLGNLRLHTFAPVSAHHTALMGTFFVPLFIGHVS